MTLDDIAAGTGIKSDGSHKQGQWRSEAIMTYDQQKREAIAAANVLIGLLMQVSDESPSTTQYERSCLDMALERLASAKFSVLSILDSQDNPE